MFGGRSNVVDVTWSDSICTLAVRKCLDINNASAVDKAVVECLEKVPSELVISMSAVEYIDSFGVGVLISVYHKTHSKQVTFRVTGARPPVQAILRLANLHRLMTID
jgi:anti-anti-sigma factor